MAIRLYRWFAGNIPAKPILERRNGEGIPGVSFAGFTPSGDLIVDLASGTRQIWRVPSGEVLSDAIAVPKPESFGRPVGPSLTFELNKPFTPDGIRLVRSRDGWRFLDEADRIVARTALTSDEPLLVRATPQRHRFAVQWLPVQTDAAVAFGKEPTRLTLHEVGSSAPSLRVDDESPIQFSPDGRTLIAGRRDRSGWSGIAARDSESGTLRWTRGLKGAPNIHSEVTMDLFKSRFASVKYGGKGDETSTQFGSNAVAHPIRFVGRHLFVTGEDDPVRLPAAWSRWLEARKWLPEGSNLTSRTLLLLDVETGSRSPPLPLQLTGAGDFDVAISPDERRFSIRVRPAAPWYDRHQVYDLPPAPRRLEAALISGLIVVGGWLLMAIISRTGRRRNPAGSARKSWR